MSPNNVYYGDCFEYISEIEQSSVDCLVTDPPYSISTDFELERGDHWGTTTLSHDFGDWDRGGITVQEWLPLFESLLKDTATLLIMYDYFRISDVVDTVEELGWEPRQIFVWHKKNPVPQGYSVKWQDAVEVGLIATVNSGQGHHYNDKEGQRHNVVETPVCMGKERYNHPTQKPEALFRPFIRWWTRQDDVVLDPFMGTGTVPVVASKMKREFIGIEENREYFDIAEKRIRETGVYTESVLDW